MNHLLSYLFFNMALAISYLVARGVLQYGLGWQRCYQQPLKLARFTLLFTIIAFWLMPVFLSWMTLHTQTRGLFQPFVRQAADQILNYSSVLPVTTANVQSAIMGWPDVAIIMTVLLCVIAGISCIVQLKHLFCLKQWVKQSYQIRKSGQVTLLLNENISIPCCFVFLRKAYVLIPRQYIEKPAHFKLAVAHELQHIRQQDTGWLYLLIALKITCFINPFIGLWLRWFNELQEFACDEAIVQRKNTSAVIYGECLLETAKNALFNHSVQQVVSLLGLKKKNSHSNLYRRINMLFQYRTTAHKTLFSLLAGLLLVLSSITTAFALNGANTADNLSMVQLKAMVQIINNNNSIQIAATPEVLSQLNSIRNDPKAKIYYQTALQKMNHYKPMIENQLQKRNMPKDLLALPLTESGYKNLDASKNIVSAAGVWQIVPATAHRYGLVINDNRDDRLNAVLSTKAALSYLSNLYNQFKDWNLALIAYEVGEDRTQQLMNQTGSRNAWTLARSTDASEDLKEYLPALNAAIIIMNNPALVS